MFSSFVFYEIQSKISYCRKLQAGQNSQVFISIEGGPISTKSQVGKKSWIKLSWGGAIHSISEGS